MRKHLIPGPFIIVFFLLALGLLAGFVAFTNSLKFTQGAPDGEAIVALTGGPDRIQAAVSLLAEGHSRKLLISGVNPSTTTHELAHRIPNFAQWNECCIELGYDAKNTIGNAAETSRWVKARGIQHSLIVVTSYYHMPRALLEIGTALPGLKLIPYPVGQPRSHDKIWSNPQTLRLVGVEYLKFIGVWLRITFFSGTNLKPDASQLRPTLSDNPHSDQFSTISRPER